MKTDSIPSGCWNACEGEVGYLVRHLRHRRRSAAMQRGIAVALVLFLGLYTSYFHVVVMADIDLHSGDLTCDQVMHGFHLFLTNALSRETEIKFQRHLDHCSACRQRRDEYLRDNQYRAPTDKIDHNTKSGRHVERAGVTSESFGSIPELKNK